MQVKRNNLHLHFWCSQERGDMLKYNDEKK